MRHGFVYIRLQIYFTLLALILGGSLLLTWRVLRQNLVWHRRLYETVLVQQVLDKMVEDIRYADAVVIYPDRAAFTRDGEAQTYLLNNRRLARRKDAYLYLTPASLPLQELSITEQNGLVEIILYGKKVWTRMVRR